MKVEYRVVVQPARFWASSSSRLAKSRPAQTAYPAANTPARQHSFKQLPAHRFSRQIRDGRVFYVYPDPTVCVCLYVGDQNAYALYRKNMFDKQLADEQQMTAQEMEMYSWDWGPWGGWPYGWYY